MQKKQYEGSLGTGSGWLSAERAGGSSRNTILHVLNFEGGYDAKKHINV